MTKNSEKKDKKVSWQVALLALAVILLGALVAGGVAIYFFGWNNSSAQRVEKIIPYPAVLMGFSGFSLREFNANVQSVKLFYEGQDFSKVGMRVDFSTEDGKARLKVKEKDILNKMIEDRAIEILARKRGAVVTDEIVSQNVARKMEEYGSRERVTEELGRLYGWSIANFEKKVVRPAMFKDELEKKFKAEDNSGPEAKQKMEKVLKDLKDGGDFAELAKQHSEGASAENGGELGWFLKEQLIPEIADTIFGMKKGERSEILESSLGFHIVEMKDRKKDSADEMVNIRQIFVAKKTFADWVGEEMRKMSIFVPLRDYAWNKDLGLVEFSDPELNQKEVEIRSKSAGDPALMF